MFIILPTLPLGQDMTQGQFFKQSLTGLNSEFSFSKTNCLTKAEEPSLPCYLPIAGGRIIGFMPFPKVLVLCKMLSVSSRIWTCVAMSISCDDSHYTTGTSDKICLYIYKRLIIIITIFSMFYCNHFLNLHLFFYFYLFAHSYMVLSIPIQH